MPSMSAIAGCVARPVETTDGVLTWKHIEPAIRPKVYYRAQTGLISLENTHNIAGGRVLPTAVQDEICDRAHDRGIPVHLDAARIFNAATYLGKSVADITRKVDSLMFCLSKGLGAARTTGAFPCPSTRRPSSTPPRISARASRTLPAKWIPSCSASRRAWGRRWARWWWARARSSRRRGSSAKCSAGGLRRAGGWRGGSEKTPPAPRPRPRQGQAPGRGAGRDSRYAPPAERRADEHPGLRRSRHRHERPGAFRQAQGTRGAGERGRPEADADGDALRRERRRDRARHPRRAGDLRRRAQELSAEFGLPNPGSILGMIEILVLRAGE